MDFTCALCGIVDPAGVTARLTHWEGTDDAKPHFNVTPRCTATHACQARLIAQGFDWPLVPSHDTDPLLLFVPRALPDPPAPAAAEDPWTDFLSEPTATEAREGVHT